MQEVILELKNRCTEKKDSILVTIVDSTGSAPRGVSSYMVVGKRGRLVGTIGGGMLEFQTINIAIEHLKHRRGGFKEYRLRIEESAELGMVCGGDVDVLCTFIDASEKNMKLLESMYRDLLTHSLGKIFLSLDGSQIHYNNLPNKLLQFSHLNVGIITDGDTRYYMHQLENSDRVFIFGGGHLAQELVPVLTHLGFRCIVTDDREEFATKELFPDAAEIHVRPYTELEGKYHVGEHDYIIAVTRGHMGDFHVQEFALHTPACYIGSVGSRSKVKAVCAKLESKGFSEKDIKRIVTPIGIEIKSETPAEIAISIAAQLILKRAMIKENKIK